MRLRVVWGFGLMMARRSPTSAFSSVDLPAFGRPKIQTKPEWKGMDLIYVQRKMHKPQRAQGSTEEVRDSGHDFRESLRSAEPQTLYQLHLARLDGRDADTLHAPIGGVQDLEPQAIAFDHFSLLRDAPGQFGHQARDGGGFLAIHADAKQFVEMIDVHIAGDHVRMIAFLHDLGFLVFIADFADDFFDQVLNGHQARDSAIFVDHDCHAHVVPAHLAQQVAAQLALGHKRDILAHEGFDGPGARLRIGHLHHVLRVDHANDVVNGIAIDRYPRERLGAEQYDKLFHRHLRGHGDHFRPQLHGFANRRAAELHDRLDQIAIARLNDAFFLARLDERIHRLGGAFRSLFRRALGQGGDGLKKTQNQRDRQDGVDQNAQQWDPALQPLPGGTREEDERKKPVEHDHDEDQAQGRLQNLLHTPGLVAEDGESHSERDRGHDQWDQHRHRKRGPSAAHPYLGLDLLLKCVDIVLKFAGEKLADLGVEAIDVGHQG